MTVIEFLKDIENYYGLEYREGQLKYILPFLEKEKKLERLLKYTFEDFPSQYKVLPDIAAFKKILNNMPTEHELLDKFI